MARFKMYIEYEGTRYSGWQVQKNARTVQGEILAALRTVLNGGEMELYGSGRTDAGVHALFQVAHLEANTMIGPEILRMKVNDELPPDINIIEVEKAPREFHARHDAVSRQYLYQISRRRTAFGKRYVWWIKDKLDVRSMREAAALFVGMKDMQSFTENDPEETSTRVLIDAVEVAEHGSLVLIRIAGSHFLWKLVRRIVGVLAEVGRGKLSVDEVKSMLASKSDAPAKFTAPPSGLFLERVCYKNEPTQFPLKPVMEIAAFGGPRERPAHERKGPPHKPSYPPHRR